MFFRNSITRPASGAAFFAACSLALAGAVPEAALEPTGPDMLALAESLAFANAEVQSLRDQNAQLRLQTETLGLAGLKPELRPLQERLIAAVADYRLADRRVKELSERVINLSEASLAILGNPNEPAAKARLQQELSAANQLLIAFKAVEYSPRLGSESSKVISLKEDLGLAVINTGSGSGLRLGTPIRIVRSDKTIASGFVVDVRERVAGLLLISDNTLGAIRIGDLAQPETISTSK